MCNVLPQVRIYICLSDDNIWTWPPSRQFRCAASVTVAIEPGTSRATFVTLALGKTCLHNPLISLCSASLECGTDSGNIPEACCCLRGTLSSFWTDRESRLHLHQPEDTGLHSTGPQLQEYYKKTVQKWRTATRLYWGFHQLSNRHNNAAAKVWTCICVLIFGGFYPTLTITFKTLVRIYVHLRGSEKKKKEWVHNWTKMTNLRRHNNKLLILADQETEDWRDDRMSGSGRAWEWSRRKVSGRGIRCHVFVSESDPQSWHDPPKRRETGRVTLHNSTLNNTNPTMHFISLPVTLANMSEQTFLFYEWTSWHWCHLIFSPF